MITDWGECWCNASRLGARESAAPVWHSAQLFIKIACASGVEAGSCAPARPPEHRNIATVSGTIVNRLFPSRTRIIFTSRFSE
jgi:hypothetical protein